MHTLWAKIGWVSIFLKKQIPNWRKWPQFESCQMYIFKIYSSSTIHQATPFNLKCIFVHSHAHPLSKNWLSQNIFKKQIPNWRKWPQFESCLMYIFKIYSSSTIHQTTAFNLKCIFVKSHAHPLSKNWLSQHIFKKTDSKLTQMTSIWELPNVYFQNLLLINNTPGLKCIFVPKIGWVSLKLHICPLIFKIYSSSTNLKCIFVHSHAHPLSKNWLSQHNFKKQIPNWRKWPQFESCQMYIFKIYSSSTIHQATPFNLKCIFVHSHAHPLSKNWLSQHIFKKQIPNWRKWPQFESCQMYIFKIYSSSTIHQATPFNLKCIFVHSLWPKIDLWVSCIKYWLSQHNFQKQIPNWHSHAHPAYFWKKFQIDANDLNLRFAKCIFSKSTPHQQYTRQQPSTSNAYLSTSTHTLWAKIGWVSIFLKKDCKLTQVTSIWKLPNVYFQNLLLINNTPGNTLQPQMHICPLPCTPFEQKLAESAYF